MVLVGYTSGEDGGEATSRMGSQTVREYSTVTFNRSRLVEDGTMESYPKHDSHINIVSKR